MVMSDTPSLTTSSLTRTAPVRRASSRITACRCRASTAAPVNILANYTKSYTIKHRQGFAQAGAPGSRMVSSAPPSGERPA
ncbi:hypothetical protein GCM10017788_46660 [Amycolatopsis acidiphila]|nr:hypothetical protein GCM10017788_46660 [Amycolatopsis acidiphila]